MKAHWKWKFCTATMGFFWKNHQNLQKHDALLMHNDALLMHNDALLMHFHRVLMHFWCTFKSASKVHHFFLMILVNFQEKNSHNWHSTRWQTLNAAFWKAQFQLKINTFNPQFVWEAQVKWKRPTLNSSAAFGKIKNLILWIPNFFWRSK